MIAEPVLEIIRQFGGKIEEPVFIERPPRDGRTWENMCARCGSTVYFEDCWQCAGEGTDGHDCGEDCCCCLRPEDNVRCDACGGEGGHWECISDGEWCQANPLDGREDVERGRIEWFPLPSEEKGGAA